MTKLSLLILSTALALISMSASGQRVQPILETDSLLINLHYLRSEIRDGDTIAHVLLDEVRIIPPWNFQNRREERRYGRLAHNVKVTLPYARLAAEKMLEINNEMAKIKDDRERRRYLRSAERELFAEFEDPLRRLTFTQGRLLIKLIDRETGDTSYNLIREYKGGVPAFFWQGIARLFGANLKDEYDPDQDDKMVEHIIQLIDMGLL
ncbi:DUF4294 domain-containing protein [Natronoflexus pectinivorans]|uniref:Uncharacterized protein DUF4294 n=1 Tax=Natronoflexus pectinivorans TaxID=682526 RepID=A0A4V2RWC3_9BACT|nr:DUF4294 domain-containing protein [Natronoflexus pectinivorans]TCO07705.1 uncharacterized protein DUF4294 [Natronoflexus pectinivorans]